AIVMPWIAHVDAALAAFLPGEATGLGIAQVLLGTTNPGALDQSIPMSRPDQSFPCPYDEGIMAGFPHYEDKKAEK
ncbi:Thermostable beta-glucosidase B (Beta-D-glucoside glucohydrolase) (Cellobiase) (Gentiobiase), partial [Durusdinium trenchii]